MEVGRGSGFIALLQKRSKITISLKKNNTFAPKLFTKIMSQKQQTLNGPLSFQGKGLHTGLNVQMTFLPAEAGSGIRFRRTDLEGAPEVEACA